MKGKHTENKNFAAVLFSETNKKHLKIKDYFYYTGKYKQASQVICSKKTSTPLEIPIVFHNGSRYNYHFIVKELEKRFKKNFSCTGENSEKYITFLFSLMMFKNIKVKFIDSFRFMNQSLSKLVDYLTIDKKPKNIFSDEFNCGGDLDYVDFKNNHMFFKCFNCNLQFTKEFLYNLTKSSANTYCFVKKEINKFIFLLRKGVYPYEYMTDWNKFEETELPPIDRFYSNLSQSGIIEIDYRHVKRVFRRFKLEKTLKIS